MGYMKIPNLYKDMAILDFKDCYSLEKIHGTSAHIGYVDGQLTFHSGGVKHENFIKIFDKDQLLSRFQEIGKPTVVVFGEAYGGSCQKMSDVYGKSLKFCAFEVSIGDCWLSVPDAESIVLSLGLEFVSYNRIPCTIEDITVERDKPSVQAERNGMGNKKREGVVLRPLIELKKNNGERIIAKYKSEDFKETKTSRNIGDKLELLKGAKKIANEWVTEMRLTHVLDLLSSTIDHEVLWSKESTRDIIKSMFEDIKIESEGEIEWTKSAEKEIGARTAKLFHLRLNTELMKAYGERRTI